MRHPHCYRLLYFISLICTIGSSFLYAQSDVSIAVMDLDGRGISAIEAASLTDRFRSEMVKTGRVTVVERSQMQNILSEQDFQMTGCTSDECAVEVGQMLGVTAMVAGSIGKVGSTYSIDLRTIDVATGQITNSTTKDYRGEIDGLLSVMSSLATDIVNFESPDTAPRAPAQVAEQPSEAGPKKGGAIVKWAVIGAAVAGGGYLGITLLAGDGDTGPTVGNPPILPEAP
ncbi:MAG: DUF2380 domain-containing protein [Candidatus Marinimicrobia bacterium]|nr:DUF2380 domain-containing protein [Candidatus Neomarinimicrobiota bacterium]